MNVGEESEYYFKAYLLKQKKEKLSDTIFGKIHQLSDDGNLVELEWKNEAELFLEKFKIQKLIDTLGIKKSKSNSKADIKINQISYSLKEISAGKPAIVNHTPRHGFEYACAHIGSSIVTLDKIIELYWELRLNGTITEDTKISHVDCPFRLYRDYLKPIIEYFLFTGTGSKISNFPAMKILEINNYKKLPDKIKIIERDDYFDQVWNKLVFSVRSKGMPNKYTEADDITYDKKHGSIAKWTKEIDGKYKGALHIRV